MDEAIHPDGDRIGERPCLQGVEQFGHEEPRIRPERVEAKPGRQFGQRLGEEGAHPPGRPGLPTPEPRVTHHLRLGQDGQEGVVGGPPVLAGLVALQGALLVAVAFEDRGVQIPTRPPGGWPAGGPG